MIINTVVCGQWAGAIPTTAMEGDNDGFSYPGGSASNCEREFKKYLSGKHKQHGNQDHLPRSVGLGRELDQGIYMNDYKTPSLENRTRVS